MARIVRRTRSGSYKIDLAPEVRDMISTLCAQVEVLLDSDGRLVARLFPPPYEDDAERNAGFAALATPELIEKRREAIGTIRSTIHLTTLTEDELMAWMRSINDIRLVLGTMLEVDDDHEIPSAPEGMEHMWGAYEYLGAVLEEIVMALGS